jgi:SHS2 domain-containing protein
MTTKLQRYKVVVDPKSFQYHGMHTDDAGAWVRFEDVKAAARAAERELVDLIRDAHNHGC